MVLQWSPNGPFKILNDPQCLFSYVSSIILIDFTALKLAIDRNCSGIVNALCVKGAHCGVTIDLRGQSLIPRDYGYRSGKIEIAVVIQSFMDNFDNAPVW